MEEYKEIVYIISADFLQRSAADAEEIIALAESAGAEVFGSKHQVLREITPATFIGKGKLEEIREELEGSPVNLIVFDGELSPSQTLNIAEVLGIKTIDRTTLILDIFALNAKTAEGKLQVELAQLKYMYPRLKGKGEGLSQQGGGIGTRGPGETQLETDRRHIRARINNLERGLEELESRRQLQTDRRKKNNTKIVALVGYTNTGKSTLLNKLTGSDVLVKNQLFATLDPTVRKLKLEDTEAVLIDTVGFVRNIPHSLVEAFKSTLETAVNADLILNICDASGNYQTQIKTTEETLKEIGANAEIITVFNKSDLVTDVEPFPRDARFISALTNQGIDDLLRAINDFFKDRFISVNGVIPYAQYGEFIGLNDSMTLKTSDFRDDGVYIEASIPVENFHRFNKFFDTPTVIKEEY